MYAPIKDGIEDVEQAVIYTELAPPSSLSGLVHCFWELKTKSSLQDDFFLHVLPDACVNILFNQLNTKIAGVTALHTTFAVLNLGRQFHYIGIQLLPGVWQGNRCELFDRYVGEPYSGDLPLLETNRKLATLNSSSNEIALSDLVQQLVSQKIIVPNTITESILNNLDEIHSVTDMATTVGLSARQLQRVLKKLTGFSPHDFLKVLRLQNSFRRGYLGSYTDQSHFIHSFRKLTGYTPEKYARKYGV